MTLCIAVCVSVCNHYTNFLNYNYNYKRLPSVDAVVAVQWSSRSERTEGLGCSTEAALPVPSRIRNSRRTTSAGVPLRRSLQEFRDCGMAQDERRTTTI